MVLILSIKELMAAGLSSSFQGPGGGPEAQEDAELVPCGRDVIVRQDMLQNAVSALDELPGVRHGAVLAPVPPQ